MDLCVLFLKIPFFFFGMVYSGYNDNTLVSLDILNESDYILLHPAGKN